MPDPTRPVAGAPVATDWGQAVHDAVFTPRGSRVTGGVSSSIGSSLTQLQLNTAVDDPAGWLASDQLTVPSGAGGLYLVLIVATTQNGAAGEFTRVVLRRNGTESARMQEDNDGSTPVWMTTARLFDLADGDTLQAWAIKSGGANPDVRIQALDVIRLGSEMGA